MRVLSVIYSPAFGGPHNDANQFLDLYRAAGIELTVLLPSDPGNALGRLRAAGVPVVSIDLHRLRRTLDPRVQVASAVNLFGDIARIRRAIRDCRADVVKTDGLVNPHAAIAAALERVPLVWHICDTRTPPAIRAVMLPFAEHMAQSLTVNGEMLVRAHWGTRPVPVPYFITYPPVDTQRFVPSADRRARTRTALGADNDTPLIGMVANLTPQKGIEYFIRAAVHVLRQEPTARFAVVGAEFANQKWYSGQLAREIADTGMGRGTFQLVGERDQTEEFYPALDVSVISSVSRSEGTTTTAFEAMSCGIPVAATTVGAIPEVVTDDVGILVRPEDPAALASSIVRLIRDPAGRRRMGVAGRLAAVSRFDVRISVRSYIAALEAAAGSRRGRRN